MRKFFVLPIALLFSLVCSCTRGQSQKNVLTPADYAEKINQLPEAPIIDVRTPSEFSQGHLVNAMNINWSGTDFESQVQKLDKSKPVFVYCLAGSRSAAAAKKMRSVGFMEVYELSGGISKWRAAKLPVTAQ